MQYQTFDPNFCRKERGERQVGDVAMVLQKCYLTLVGMLLSKPFCCRVPNVTGNRDSIPYIFITGRLGPFLQVPFWVFVPMNSDFRQTNLTKTLVGSCRMCEILNHWWNWIRRNAKSDTRPRFEHQRKRQEGEGERVDIGREKGRRETSGECSYLNCNAMLQCAKCHG